MSVRGHPQASWATESVLFPAFCIKVKIRLPATGGLCSGHAVSHKTGKVMAGKHPDETVKKPGLPSRQWTGEDPYNRRRCTPDLHENGGPCYLTSLSTDNAILRRSGDVDSSIVTTADSYCIARDDLEPSTTGKGTGAKAIPPAGDDVFSILYT